MNETPAGAAGHNHGLDALKVLSMMMVLMLHFLGFGGLLGAAPGEANYYVAWSLEACSIVAVNCFMMATGYLAAATAFKIKRIVLLWMQVVFYSVGITVLCAVVFDIDIMRIHILKSVLPVTSSAYWYVTAYFGAACFMPVIDRGLRALNKASCTALAVALVFLFSVMPSVLNKNPFATNFGYTVIWFLVMYIMGYCIRIANPLARTKTGFFLGAYLVLTFASLAPKLAYRQFEASPLNSMLVNGLTLQYTFPTVLFASMALFMFFSRLRIKSPVSAKVWAFFAPLSFAAYLIHMHPIVKTEFLTGSSMFLLDDPPFVTLVSCIVIVAGLFVAMSLIDAARKYLFDLLRLPGLADKAVAAAGKRLIRE